MHNIAWTQEQVEQLKSLFNEGYSYALIGAKMGYSRSACIGKANRLGLGRIDGAKPQINLRTTKPKAIPKTKSKPALRIVSANGNSAAMRLIDTVVVDLPTFACIEVEPLHLGLMDLIDTSCRYVFGDEPQAMTFCGRQIKAGSSYCPAHHARCRMPPAQPRQPAFTRRRVA